MPLYVYECSDCGRRYERTLKVDERYTGGPTCCHGNVKIVPQAPRFIMGAAQFEAYKCPVTDQTVTTQRQRREIMKEHDLIEQPQIKSGEW